MKMIRSLIQRPLLAASLLAVMGSVATPAFAGKTLDAIKSRGMLNCGVNPSFWNSITCSVLTSSPGLNFSIICRGSPACPA